MVSVEMSLAEVVGICIRQCRRVRHASWAQQQFKLDEVNALDMLVREVRAPPAAVAPVLLSEKFDQVTVCGNGLHLILQKLVLEENRVGASVVRAGQQMR